MLELLDISAELFGIWPALKTAFFCENSTLIEKFRWVS